MEDALDGFSVLKN